MVRKWFEVERVEEGKVVVWVQGALSENETFLQPINHEVLSKVEELLGEGVSQLELDVLGGFIFQVTDVGPTLQERLKQALSNTETLRKKPTYPHLAKISENISKSEHRPTLNEILNGKNLDNAVNAVLSLKPRRRVHRT